MVGLRRREGVPLRRLLVQQGFGRQAEIELRCRLAPFEQRGLLLVEGAAGGSRIPRDWPSVTRC